jgi:hypothetical protein
VLHVLGMIPHNRGAAMPCPPAGLRNAGLHPLAQDLRLHRIYGMLFGSDGNNNMLREVTGIKKEIH